MYSRPKDNNIRLNLAGAQVVNLTDRSVIFWRKDVGLRRFVCAEADGGVFRAFWDVVARFCAQDAKDPDHPVLELPGQPLHAPGAGMHAPGAGGTNSESSDSDFTVPDRPLPLFSFQSNLRPEGEPRNPGEGDSSAPSFCDSSRGEGEPEPCYTRLRPCKPTRCQLLTSGAVGATSLLGLGIHHAYGVEPHGSGVAPPGASTDCKSGDPACAVPSGSDGTIPGNATPSLPITLAACALTIGAVWYFAPQLRECWKSFRGYATVKEGGTPSQSQTTITGDSTDQATRVDPEPPTEPPESEPENSSKSGSPIGAIVTVTIIAVTVAGIAVGLFVWKRKSAPAAGGNVEGKAS